MLYLSNEEVKIMSQMTQATPVVSLKSREAVF